MKPKTRIGFWNVRTLRGATRLAEAEQYLFEYNLLLLGMSETRRNGFGEVLAPQGSTLLYSGKGEDASTREHGVAFLLSRAARHSLIKWQAVSERIVTARFNATFKIFIVLCYAPTETSDVQSKENFYHKLAEVVSSINEDDVLILMGDFNARIGGYDKNYERCMGKHSLGKRNQNGQMFLEFCLKNELAVGWSMFPHRSCHRYTWTSPNGRTRNQIDHIAVNTKSRWLLLDVRNRRGADIDSDHELVVALMRLNVLSYHHCSSVTLNILEESGLKEGQAFMIELRNRFQALCLQDIQTKRRLVPSEITLGTWDLIKKRRDIKLQLLSTSIAENQLLLRHEYRAIRNMIHYSLKTRVF